MLLSNLLLVLSAALTVSPALAGHRTPIYAHRRWPANHSPAQVSLDVASDEYLEWKRSRLGPGKDNSTENGGLVRRQGGCPTGGWKCAGQELMRCVNGQWMQISMCDGINTICVASNPNAAPGCVWPNTSPANNGQVASPSAPVAPPAVSPSANAAPVASSEASSTDSSPNGQYQSPHYVVYLDDTNTQMPTAAELAPWNRFLLAFWLTDGAWDWAEQFSSLAEADRQGILDDYHNSGIALMVSAFGATDYPTSQGADPVKTAQDLAAFVKQNNLDGCDIDYEDSNAFVSGTAEDWLISFQTELRNQLPPPYLISHAPQPPYMTPAGQQFTVAGGYAKIHQAVGGGIDWYAVQFYNQGDALSYTTCDQIVVSGQGTSILEISQNTGIPLNKLVLGKPLNQAGVFNTGLLDASTLHQCYELAESKGWNAGIMVWQYDASAPDFLNTVLGN